MDNVSLAVHRFVSFLLIIKFDPDHGGDFSSSLPPPRPRCYATAGRRLSSTSFPPFSRRASCASRWKLQRQMRVCGSGPCFSGVHQLPRATSAASCAPWSRCIQWRVAPLSMLKPPGCVRGDAACNNFTLKRNIDTYLV